MKKRILQVSEVFLFAISLYVCFQVVLSGDLKQSSGWPISAILASLFVDVRKRFA